MRHKMNLHPFYDCVARADQLIKQGHTVYQQFNCAYCGIKQTVENANYFTKFGDCEECGKRTNIEQDGCNYMVLSVIRL